MCKRLLALLLAVRLLGAGGAFAFSLDEEGRSALDQKLDKDFARYQTMGACTVLFENGEIVYTHCYGLQRRGGDPVTEACGFQVGSIGKLVANVGLMRLVEQGAAGLEDDLSDLLGFAFRSPYFPDTPITLRQLMTHTAGLRDSTWYQAALGGDPLPLSQLLQPPQVNALFMDKTEPGTESVYTNFGGGLIGSLIEKLSGRTVDDYLEENLFVPLGITAAYQPALLWDDMPLCDMYYMPGKRLAKRLREDTAAAYAPDFERHYYLTAGKLVISAPDLAKVLMMLCDGGVYGDVRILKESTVREMTTLQNMRGSVLCDSGRGLFMNIITDAQVEGRTMYGHGGKALGMLCAAYYDPLDRTGVVMLTNGCQNKSTYRNVGMLGRLVMRDLYRALENGEHVVEDRFVVE